MTEKGRKDKKNGMQKLDKYTPLLMLLPAAAAVMLVSVYPTLKTMWLSFFDKQLLKKTVSFIGLSNYAAALKNPDTWQVILNTLFFAVVRAMFLIPWVTPPLVASFVWRTILSANFSPLNSMLLKLGIVKVPVSFLESTQTYLGFLSVPLIMITLINVWSIFPFLMVMFIAGLQTVPKELYEAATMDGAGKIKSFWKITVPCIRPVISVSVLLELIWQFNNFNISYMVTQGGPLGLTKLLAVEVYQQAFTNFKYGYASAVSVIMMCIALVPAVFYIRSSLKEIS